MAVLVLRCCAGFSLVEVSRGSSLVAVHKLFIVVASRCREWAQECMGLVVVVLRLLSTGSVAVAPWAFSCPAACGIFPDQGLNLCLLHWQVGYLPLSHQGIYPVDFFKNLVWNITCISEKEIIYLSKTLCINTNWI